MINHIYTNGYRNMAATEKLIDALVDRVNEIIDLLNSLEENACQPYIISEDKGLGLNEILVSDSQPFDIQQWISSFDTESAPQCFNAVQELKKRLNGQMD